MFLHIVIYAGLAGTVLIVWLHTRKSDRKNFPAGAFRLLLTISLLGNTFGLFLTVTRGSGEIYSEGEGFLRKDGAAYYQEVVCTVDGKEYTVRLLVPEKKSENAGEQSETARTGGLPEEESSRSIRNAVSEYNLQGEDPDYYHLPSEVEGVPVQWKEPDDHSGMILSGLFLAAGILVLFRAYHEEDRKRKKREEQMLLDYPGILMKFTLLTGAGMSARRAFMKIGYDYQKEKEKERYAYEEILRLCREMDSGVSEVEAYQRFGERCAVVNYRTFSTMLIQNLMHGSRILYELLERDSMEAWDERKRRARVQGETAATKLLIPMVLMLTISLVVIMVPAFLSFY